MSDWIVGVVEGELRYFRDHMPPDLHSSRSIYFCRPSDSTVSFQAVLEEFVGVVSPLHGSPGDTNHPKRPAA